MRGVDRVDHRIGDRTQLLGVGAARAVRDARSIEARGEGFELRADGGNLVIDFGHVAERAGCVVDSRVGAEVGLARFADQGRGRNPIAFRQAAPEFRTIERELRVVDAMRDDRKLGGICVDEGSRRAVRIVDQGRAIACGVGQTPRRLERFGNRVGPGCARRYDGPLPLENRNALRQFERTAGDGAEGVEIAECAHDLAPLRRRVAAIELETIAQHPKGAHRLDDASRIGEALTLANGIVQELGLLGNLDREKAGQRQNDGQEQYGGDDDHGKKGPIFTEPRKCRRNFSRHLRKLSAPSTLKNCESAHRTSRESPVCASHSCDNLQLQPCHPRLAPVSWTPR